MKRLLIITANFPPTNAVDVHRVRQSLSFYEQFGWKPQVLCFDPASADHPRDERLMESIPQDVAVHRVRCIDRRWTRPFGLHAAGFRGWPAMRRGGLRVIQRGKPDLVFFSTTSFPLMALGPTFQSAAGSPYVLDFQDPWVSPEGSVHQRSMKHHLVRRLHTYLEPRAVRNAAGLMSVSADYLEVLNQRYPSIADKPQVVIPFGASADDLQLACRPGVSASWPEPLRRDLECKRVGMYAGAYVPTMDPMIGALFQSLRRAISEDETLKQRLRIWFVGSNYSVSDPRTRVIELASKYGVQDVVREWPWRVPYFDALAMGAHADFNLLFGSASKGYNPSKLFTLLQAKRPLLAFVQPQTMVHDLLQQAGGARIVSVEPSANSIQVDDALTRFLREPESIGLPDWNFAFIDQYSAEATTRRQAEFFREALERSSRHQQTAAAPSAAA